LGRGEGDRKGGKEKSKRKSMQGLGRFLSISEKGKSNGGTIADRGGSEKKAENPVENMKKGADVHDSFVCLISSFLSGEEGKNGGRQDAW